MANLEVEFCGVKFKNPLVAASAEPTLNADNMKRCFDAGAAGVIAKTMTDSEAMRELTTRSKWRYLNESHRVCRGKVPQAFSFYGRSGLALEPPKEFLVEIREAVRYGEESGSVVIGSVAGTEIPGWVELAKQIEGEGVPIIELNFGCPHPHLMPGVRTGMNVGQDFNYGTEIAHAVSKAVNVPVLIKVTPQVTDLVTFSEMLVDAGAAGVTLTNRFIGFVPDVETAEPLIYGKAGVGGPWIKPLTLRWIHDVYMASGGKTPITGTNGVFDWHDIIQYIMTGANIVQMCSAVMVHGYEWLGKQVEGIEKFMDEKGYETVEEMRGLASRAALQYADMPAERARVNKDECIHCKRCLKVCFYDAMNDTEDATEVNTDNCVGCGGCYSVCPAEGAIDIYPAP